MSVPAVVASEAEILPLGLADLDLQDEHLHWTSTVEGVRMGYFDDGREEFYYIRFDLETGEPIPFDEESVRDLPRIVKRLEEKADLIAGMDEYFLSTE